MSDIKLKNDELIEKKDTPLWLTGLFVGSLVMSVAWLGLPGFIILAIGWIVGVLTMMSMYNKI